MRRNIFIVLCILFVLCFSGCVATEFTNEKVISGKGKPERYEIAVGEYSGIRVEGLCEIRYFAAPSNAVTLEIQPNLREYYVVEVQNGELIIRSTRKINYSSKSSTPVITVSTPALNNLIIEGMCTFKANDKINGDAFNLEIRGASDGKAEFDVNTLKASMAGAGNFEFSGKADIAEINMSGAGKLNALSLQTREASVNLSGAGTIKINSSEKLSIKASGVGTVEYKGSPNLSLNTGGVVSIRQVD